MVGKYWRWEERVRKGVGEGKVMQGKGAEERGG